MIPGDFQIARPSGKRLALLGLLGIVGLGVTVVAIGAMVFVISAWLGRPLKAFGVTKPPVQPLAFPHPSHVEKGGIDCTFCHRNVTTGKSASIPALGLCMTCHKSVGTDLPGVQQLQAIYASGKPLEWVRVHRLPDHVHFVHEAHIRGLTARTLESTGVLVEPAAVCSTCHGDVGSMVVVEQVRSLKMSDCVDCHRQNSAPTDCITCHY